MNQWLFYNAISMVVLKRFRQVRVIFFRFLRSLASLLRHFLHVTSAEIPASRLQALAFVLQLLLCAPFSSPYSAQMAAPKEKAEVDDAVDAADLQAAMCVLAGSDPENCSYSLVRNAFRTATSTAAM